MLSGPIPEIASIGVTLVVGVFRYDLMRSNPLKMGFDFVVDAKIGPIPQLSAPSKIAWAASSTVGQVRPIHL